LLPYDFENNKKTNKYFYISGSYFVIKKNIGLKNLLEENLTWGEGEDAEYTTRLHEQNIIIKCNKYSSVYFLKQKPQHTWETEINEEMLKKFVDYCENEED
jgi:hypothetical protein